MKNSNALKFYKNMSQNSSLNPNSVKLAKNSDFSNIDANFILKYTNKHSVVLDLGSGTGLVINKIYKKINYILAIEPFKEFTNFIIKTPKIKIINENILNFKSHEKFDLITIFAVVQYFNQNEIIKIYTKCRNNLKNNGKLIIKGQFGVKDDVLISGYSDELKTDYYSQYRHLKKEINILKKIGYKNIKSIDIYPPECNRWNNTHFYAITAEK
jgi:SAM-dependent methyltransferase